MLVRGIHGRLRRGLRRRPDPAVHRRKVEKLHRTDTCDVIVCVKGEIYLMTDTDEVLMRPGDSTVIRGVNHGWSNRTEAPALLAVAMLDASG
jgi:quercetin dioxygenase-like cupin family protein